MTVRYVEEFRDRGLARSLATAIAAAARPDRDYHLMEFCGGHTHAIFRYGVQDLLPPNVQMIHGPGCPVCVLPAGRMDHALQLACHHEVILCTYGDLVRVPGLNRMTLLKAKAAGADVRMVYSSLDALKIAQENPQRQVVFFAIGFETTTPPTAVALMQARALGLTNFSVHCNHVLTPSAIHGILASAAADDGELKVDGFVGPAHVSAVIGSKPFETFAGKHGYPIVIAGFEPLDVMQAILMLIRQLNQGRAEVENEYTRVVSPNGNQRAQDLMAQVFLVRDAFEWRGLGIIPRSALMIRDSYRDLDAERRFGLKDVSVPDHKACECAAVLRGVKKPPECRIFGTGCTPENPIGSCMVSSEGACAAYYSFGRFRQSEPVMAPRA